MAGLPSGGHCRHRWAEQDRAPTPLSHSCSLPAIPASCPRSSAPPKAAGAGICPPCGPLGSAQPLLPGPHGGSACVCHAPQCPRRITCIAALSGPGPLHMLLLAGRAVRSHSAHSAQCQASLSDHPSPQLREPATVLAVFSALGHSRPCASKASTKSPLIARLHLCG